MSDISYDAVVFTGSDGLTSGQFLRIVRQNALQQDRSKNDEWIAQWAASHLDGPALFWYEALTEEIQESWKLLRRELLVRWAAPTPNEETLAVIPPAQSSVIISSQSATIPTPAAAPPSIQIRTTPLVNQEIRGRIRAFTTTGMELGFVSRKPNSDNDYCVTRSEADALIVRFISSDQPHEINISDTELLGITFHSKHSPENAMTQGRMHGSIGIVTRDPGGSNYVSSSKYYHGDPRGQVWNIFSDGTILISCQTSRFRFFLEPAVSKNSGAVTITSHYAYHKEVWTARGWNARQAKFIFDPIS